MCKNNQYGQEVQCPIHIALGVALEIAQTDRLKGAKVFQAIMIGKAYEEFHHEVANAGRRLMHEHRDPKKFGFEVAKMGLETVDFTKEIEGATEAELMEQFADFEQFDRHISGDNSAPGLDALLTLLGVGVGAQDRVRKARAQRQKETDDRVARANEMLRRDADEADADIAPRKTEAVTEDPCTDRHGCATTKG